MSVVAEGQDTYFISAGEHSGDLLGAQLIYALRREMPDLMPFGSMGAGMIRAGGKAILSIQDLSVMGVWEVGAKLAQLRQIEFQLLASIDRMQPKFCLLIDFPGLHLRLAEQLKLRGHKVFQFVAPKVWAWGSGRIPALRQYFDMLLGILPFEEDFFRQHGVPYHYVGTPQLERTAWVEVQKEQLGFAAAPVVAFLPGSRPSEIRHILPHLIAIRAALAQLVPEAIAVIPVAENLDFDVVQAMLQEHLSAQGYGSFAALRMTGDSRMTTFATPCGPFYLTRGAALETLKVADAAVVASGTATLECGLLEIPMAVVYHMNPLSYKIATRLVKIPHVSLVNIIAGREIVPEFLQHIDAHQVAHTIAGFLQNPVARQQVVEDLREMKENLTGDCFHQAARTIAERINAS